MKPLYESLNKNVAFIIYHDLSWSCSDRLFYYTIIVIIINIYCVIHHYWSRIVTSTSSTYNPRHIFVLLDVRLFQVFITAFRGYIFHSNPLFFIKKKNQKISWPIDIDFTMLANNIKYRFLFIATQFNLLWLPREIFSLRLFFILTTWSQFFEESLLYYFIPPPFIV